MDQALLENWLQLQCRVIPDVRRAFVQVELPESGGALLQAAWPASSVLPDSLGELLGLARRSGNPVTSHSELRRVAGSDTVDPGAEASLLLARPLRLSDSGPAAIVLELPGTLQRQQQAVANLVEWGNAWLNFACSPRAGAAPQIGEYVKLASDLSAHRSFQAAAMAAAGWLAHRFDCRRVSLLRAGGRRFRLSASSDKAIVAERTDLAQRLEQAVESAQTEAGAADPDAPEPASSELQTSAEGDLYTGLLRIDGEVFAGLVFEPDPGAALGPGQQREIAALLPLLGGLLGLRRQREQTVFNRLGRAMRRTSGWVRPLAIWAGALALALWLYTDTHYRVAGDAVVEGEVQQVLVAPFDGYIAQAGVRAGERVRSGQTLAELDDKELRLQRRLREGDRSELQKEYRKALAGMDHAQARILEAQIVQAEAEIELLDRQLARTRVQAPFDGLVVSGDLSRSLGKPVERGEILFEVAPLDSYRVAIEIRDRDIREIEVGRRGALALAALPVERLPLEVVNVTHFSGSGNESGRFRVEAHLLDSPLPAGPEGMDQLLRPGMRGVAKIELGQRPRFWVWSHPLIDWLRLQAWTWLP